ncbi:cold-shock protein (plasmid) [Shinella sp. PSBB067]|uniref:cold-shock protein n=1 Tax=unclassified Shinella TaxID=2643062 RepID=UPI000929F4AC|nr:MULTISPECIES: cold-shock protein [unclassified Shinella]MBN9052355.1 cold-shock protein [Hyphomicrobiales bacterium]OJU88610.1 MAG: hypothetical protein BGO06_16890 [Shinella sp. 65-6]QRI66461.1 cold-shock protein [Shinella sp. PSBB067]
MSRTVHAIGDRVTLRASLFRPADTDRTCRIVAILPSDHGEVQYRVRMGEETCERRIVASDIEAPETARPGKTAGPSSARRANEPWFKPSSIRIKK